MRPLGIAAPRTRGSPAPSPFSLALPRPAPRGLSHRDPHRVVAVALSRPSSAHCSPIRFSWHWPVPDRFLLSPKSPPCAHAWYSVGPCQLAGGPSGSAHDDSVKALACMQSGSTGIWGPPGTPLPYGCEAWDPSVVPSARLGVGLGVSPPSPPLSLSLIAPPTLW